MMNGFLSWLILLQFYCSCAGVVRTKTQCGYKQCPQTRDGALNVHLIPHSHMDAGWVKTFDEYYYGTKVSVSTANVQLIYHSVLLELLQDKRRKFTFSESGYFWRWWKEQPPYVRSSFRTLVQEGRIEFAGGGWVQNDEATVDYLSIIDQFTWGLRKLNDTLGPCGKPKAAWQIDTYGHTKEQTSLMAQMGFDGLFIGRVEFGERIAMMAEDRMEFMWRGSDVLGKMSDIMTHTLFNLYNPPQGFCFDFLCSDEPIMDEVDSKLYNADQRVADFISQVERQAKYYDHDNIVVMMGGDFAYQSAANWFMNMDKLIDHVTAHPANLSDVNIFYSTPSCFLKAIYLAGRKDKTVYTEKGDHLPYGSDTATYWTGFYSSRPALKYYVRRAHEFLQVVKQLTVLSRNRDIIELHLLRHAVSLVQHHDAITGTSQQHVIDYYLTTLSEAINACSKKVSAMLSNLTPTWSSSRRSKNSQQFIICHQLNITQCRFSETQESIILLVYNPSSIKSYHYVRLPATAMGYTVRDANNDEVQLQLVPVPGAVKSLPGRQSHAVSDLYFEADYVPPLGYSAFYITALHDILKEKQSANNNDPEDKTDAVTTISNEYIRVTINKETGLLESIAHVEGIKIQVLQNYFVYQQTAGGLQSGAYSFRTSSAPTVVTEKATYTVLRGQLVKEIRQTFTEWISQVIRLYRGEEFVELEWIIGPVPIGSELGKEVVSRFSTNITNHGEFHTDSNGRLMMQRTCWNESTGDLHKKPIPACYYPVTSRICIHSTNTSVELCVLTDRSQGGTSYNDGDLELMVHRRLLTDDGFGLDEPLNEEAHGAGLVVRGKHRLMFGNYRLEVEEQSFSERVSAAARRWRYEPWLFMTSGDKINRRRWQSVRNKRFSGLRVHALPRHVHILTLEPWKGGSVLLRIENTLEKVRGPGGDEDLESLPFHIILVDLQKVFTIPIRAIRETTLAANQWLDEARQMDWSSRYVYNGGSDATIPEDNVEETYDDPATHYKTHGKENIQYLEDDTVRKRRSKSRYFNTNKRNARNYNYRYDSRNKQNKRNYDDTYDYEHRRKRSTNTNIDVHENIINKTVEDNFAMIFGNDTVENYTENDNVTSNSEIAVVDNNEEKITTKTTDVISTVFDGATTSKYTIPYKKLSKRKRESDETESSEEDSENHKRQRNLEKLAEEKRRKKLRKNKRPLSRTESSNPQNEDVTKSMYEMYYKQPSRVKKYYARKKTEQIAISKTKPKNQQEDNEDTSHERIDKYFNRNTEEELTTPKRRSKTPKEDYQENSPERININYDSNVDEQVTTPTRRSKKPKDNYQDITQERIKKNHDRNLEEEITTPTGRTKKQKEYKEDMSIENVMKIYYKNIEKEIKSTTERTSKQKEVKEDTFIEKIKKNYGTNIEEEITTHTRRIKKQKGDNDESSNEKERIQRRIKKRRKLQKSEIPFMSKGVGGRQRNVRSSKEDHSREDSRERKYSDEVKKMAPQKLRVNPFKVRPREKDPYGFDTDYEADPIEEDEDIRAQETEDYREDTVRNRRSIRETLSEGDQEEYLVTLRPTQIRTFVIWFEEKTSAKKELQT